jgi:hypothetical protein
MGMRHFAPLLLTLLLPLAGAGAKKPEVPVASRGENQEIIVTATLYATPDLVKQALGSDLDGHYIVVAVKVEPKFGKEVAIDRDDFVLRTDKDGERTKPFAPSQIAGRGALVIRQTSEGGAMGQNNGPMIGGIPGTLGGPMQLPGNGGSVGSTGAGDIGSAEARADNGTKQKENPVLKVLHDKILPEKKTDQPLSGMLYFPMEKQKVKDLELVYGARDNIIRIRFK